MSPFSSRSRTGSSPTAGSAQCRPGSGLTDHGGDLLAIDDPHKDRRGELAEYAGHDRLNTLIATGSRHLYKDDSDELRATVLAARRDFLAQLGISARRAAQSGRNLLLRSKIVINSRLLTGYGIHMRKLASDPGPLACRSDVVQAMLEHLAGIGVDVKLCR